MKNLHGISNISIDFEIETKLVSKTRKYSSFDENVGENMPNMHLQKRILYAKKIRKMRNFFSPSAKSAGTIFGGGRSSPRARWCSVNTDI
jgi:hypothetical protein